MTKVFVTPVKLSVRRKWEKDNLKLGQVDDLDCLACLKDKITAQATLLKDDERKTAYSLTREFGVIDRFIFGRYDLGEYSTERLIRNVDTGALTGKIKKGEAPMSPRFFMGYIPSNETSAIFLMETGTLRCVETALKAAFDNYKIDLHPFASKEAWESFYKEAIVSSVTATLVKKDIADNKPKTQAKSSKDYKRKLILSSGRGNGSVFSEWIRGIIRRNKPEELIHAIDVPEGYEAREVAIKLANSDEGRTVTTYLDRSLLVPRLGLKATTSSSGHPTFESLFREGYKEISTLAAKLKIEGEITNVVKNKYPKNNP